MEFSQTLIQPEWPAPQTVKAVVTTRNRPGEKIKTTHASPYSAFNLAYHTGDSAINVAENRQQLETMLGLKYSPCWLDQRHGTRVISVHEHAAGAAADASFAVGEGPACVIQSADCLPVLFCNKQGTRVAAAHAGWRGLANGIIAAAFKTLDTAAEDVLAWLGPAIGPEAYEVDRPVYDAFVKRNPDTEDAFGPARAGHWFVNLYTLARQDLLACGIRAVYGGGFCTYTQAKLFYSHRRNPVTGRMASLIWIE